MTKRKPMGFTIVVLACWVLLLIGDWFMRFYWFGWHTNLIERPSAVVSSHPEKAMQDSWSDAKKGGDLTRLIDIPDVSHKYAEMHPAIHRITDEYGFRNKPPTSGKYYPVVVVGDSFMNIDYEFTNSFANQLAYILQTNVYNRSISGRGAIWAVEKFFNDRRFVSTPPRYLVWGLLEREIHGNMIAGSLVWDLWIREHPEDNKPLIKLDFVDINIHVKQFSLKALIRSLPNTSALAQLGRKIWNKLRYMVFGRLNPEVVVADKSVLYKPMLFYKESIDFMCMDDEERMIDHVVWGINYLSEFCERRGIRLVVVLIPDKAQVYRTLIPDFVKPLSRLPRSCLWALETGLETNGIAVINLLPTFHNKAQQGELLYWRDDTHWKPEAVRIAADRTAMLIEGCDNESQ